MKTLTNLIVISMFTQLSKWIWKTKNYIQVHFPNYRTLWISLFLRNIWNYVRMCTCIYYRSRRRNIWLCNWYPLSFSHTNIFFIKVPHHIDICKCDKTNSQLHYHFNIHCIYIDFVDFISTKTNSSYIFVWLRKYGIFLIVYRYSVKNIHNKPITQ